MMYLKNKKPLTIFLSALLLFAACKKDADNPTSETPVTEPLSVAAAKPGDTIIIKGQNFSEVAANNTVKFNGVTATVVSATATEIKVVVPAGATSGSITVTVNGTTTEVGSLTIAPLTLYTIKESDSTLAPKRLIAIDPANGNQTEIAILTGLPEFEMYKIQYLAATNEIVRYNDSGTVLLKINITTKAQSSVRISNNSRVRFKQLVTDKSGNLYATQHKEIENEVVLVKLDPVSGNNTAVKSIGATYNWQNLVYVPARNEIAGIIEGRRLFRLNLTTKDTASAQLVSIFDNIGFTELVTDNQSNLIGCRNENPAPPADYSSHLVKINPVTGEQTLVTTLSEYYPFSYSGLTFLPERNEITGIWNDTGLYRFNVSTKASSTLTINTQDAIHYNGITHN